MYNVLITLSEYTYFYISKSITSYILLLLALNIVKSVQCILKVIKIIGQKKAFYRQGIPESSCARKETVDIDILITSRNGDRKITQSTRITRRPFLRIKKWNQWSQFR